VAEHTDKPFGTCPELPAEAQDIFRDLCQDLASLHGKWQLYLQLYSDPETVNLLNDTARAAFQMIEESLRSDITMSICRLSDPPRSCGQDNLSMETLVQKLAHIDGLKELHENFQERCKDVRIYRNKRVGHDDLRASLHPHDNLLPNITRNDIEGILAAAARLMNHVYRSYVDGELCFQPFAVGDGKALLYWLKEAKECDDAEREKALGRK
jgi:hypothetical protein